MKIENAIAGRALGAIPVSIATSLAIESACGVHPEIPVDIPPVRTVQHLLVNVRTLVRNIYGAIEGDEKKRLHARDVAPFVIDEMATIDAAVNNASGGACEVIFYFPMYMSLGRSFANAKLKIPQTDNQKHYMLLENSTYAELVKFGVPHDFRQIDMEIKDVKGSAMILTHYPVDLLSAKHFRSLVLVESHTGKIKNHLQWHTKLTNGNELTRIPFNRFSLQVFGDKATHFLGLSQHFKKLVENMAAENAWTILTKEEKILYSIDKLQDVNDKAVLKSLIRHL